MDENKIADLEAEVEDLKRELNILKEDLENALNALKDISRLASNF